MPLTIPQVLDLLMALVLVMFVPIGLWRGALREWIALAGILLGSMLAAEWAEPWGRDLAAQTAIDPRVANFAVAALFFLGVTLFVGYGAGVALPYRPDLSWPNRVLGATLGLGNGLLILSSALRIMQRHLFDGAPGSPLFASGLAVFLILYIGWAELVLLVIFLLSVLAGLVRRGRHRPPLLEEYAPVFDDDASATALAWNGTAAYAPYDDAYAEPPPPPGAPPAAVPWPRPSEPGVGYDAQDTAQLPPVAPPVREVVAPADHPPPPRSDDAPAGPAPLQVSEIARPAPRQGVGPPVGPDSAPATPGAVEVASADTTSTACAICGTSVPARARFCPTCGHIIGDAERRTVARLH